MITTYRGPYSIQHLRIFMQRSFNLKPVWAKNSSSNMRLKEEKIKRKKKLITSAKYEEKKKVNLT